MLLAHAADVTVLVVPVAHRTWAHECRRWGRLQGGPVASKRLLPGSVDDGVVAARPRPLTIPRLHSCRPWQRPRHIFLDVNNRRISLTIFSGVTGLIRTWSAPASPYLRAAPDWTLGDHENRSVRRGPIAAQDFTKRIAVDEGERDSVTISERGSASALMSPSRPSDAPAISHPARVQHRRHSVRVSSSASMTRLTVFGAVRAPSARSRSSAGRRVRIRETIEEAGTSSVSWTTV